MAINFKITLILLISSFNFTLLQDVTPFRSLLGNCRPNDCINKCCDINQYCPSSKFRCFYYCDPRNCPYGCCINDQCGNENTCKIGNIFLIIIICVSIAVCIIISIIAVFLYRRRVFRENPSSSYLVSTEMDANRINNINTINNSYQQTRQPNFNPYINQEVRVNQGGFSNSQYGCSGLNQGGYSNTSYVNFPMNNQGIQPGCFQGGFPNNNQGILQNQMGSSGNDQLYPNNNQVPFNNNNQYHQNNTNLPTIINNNQEVLSNSSKDPTNTLAISQTGVNSQNTYIVGTCNQTSFVNNQIPSTGNSNQSTQITAMSNNRNLENTKNQPNNSIAKEEMITIDLGASNINNNKM